MYMSQRVSVRCRHGSLDLHDDQHILCCHDMLEMVLELSHRYFLLVLKYFAIEIVVNLIP